MLVLSTVVGSATLTSQAGRAAAVTGTVAYERYGHGDWITVADLLGTAQHLITSRRDSVNPVWSPDGSRLAFMHVTEAGIDGLYVANRDGTGVRRVLRLHGTVFNVAYPSWSPDGRRLAYGGGGPLYVVNSDGRNARTLLASPTCSPVWSPDGRSLIFFLIDPAQTGCPSGEGTLTPAPGYRSLYRIDGDGTHRRLLATGSFSDAAWSPDSSQIAFTANCENLHATDWTCSIFAMKPDGSGKHRLVKSTPSAGWVEWAAGGKEILSSGWTSPDGMHVYATDVSTGRQRRLIGGSTTTWCTVAGVSKDGQTVALDSCSHAQIAVATLSARPPQLVRVPNGWTYRQASVYLP